MPTRGGILRHSGALKNLISTMTDIILQQVPTMGCEPSHRHALVGSPLREIAHPERDGQSQGEYRNRSKGVVASRAHKTIPRKPAKSATAKSQQGRSMPYTTHSGCTSWFEEQEQTSKPRGEILRRQRALKRRPIRERTRGPLSEALQPQNVQKYYEFHEQSGHTTAECRELKKALHELADKVWIVTTIADEYAEGITWSTWKAQLRGAQQALTAETGSCVTVPSMVFDRREGSHFPSPHNDLLVVELKVASALI
ncbi:hypothetical protein Cgig2_006735 [Carnegiea gigantea]|uniref:Uncharacterized protein n=1 Tax=Carnegiea gigantea TaxID=171969 RepID=A0A9Q1GYY6_9CARY|nr:hypothetical protein Cgig2_006735 [Carnegiea gigantea]